MGGLVNCEALHVVEGFPHPHPAFGAKNLPTVLQPVPTFSGTSFGPGRRPESSKKRRHLLPGVNFCFALFFLLQGHPNIVWPLSPLSFPKVKKEVGPRGPWWSVSGTLVCPQGQRRSPHDLRCDSEMPGQSGILAHVAQMFLSGLFLFMANGCANNPWTAFL